MGEAILPSFFIGERLANPRGEDRKDATFRYAVYASSLPDRQFPQFLPGVRDGDSAAIHDARVATRRMRELVPLSPAD